MQKQHLRFLKVEDGKVLYLSRVGEDGEKKMLKTICGKYVSSDLDAAKIKDFKSVGIEHRCSHCQAALEKMRRELKV